MNTKQPEALRLANILRGIDARSLFANEKLSAASAALENQHARITELEAQLAQRFDAADMATAAAQGFLDGVTSAALESTPAQPVAEPAEALSAGRPLRSKEYLAAKYSAAALAARAQAQPVAEPTHAQIAAYLEATGAYVTNDASREAAIADAVEADRASHGQAPADAAPSAGAVAGPDDIDAIALTRYKVVHSHDSMFHRFAVVAGDGKQQLYLGRETECQNMTRKFAGAFLDGAFYQSQIAAAPTPAAQAAKQQEQLI